MKNRECVKNLRFIDVDYFQFSEWGYKKPTRIWGCPAIAELENRLCDGFSCPHLERTLNGGVVHKIAGWYGDGKRNLFEKPNTRGFG